MNHLLRYCAMLVFFTLGAHVHAADQNGYTAQYECRAGGPKCNVDIAAYTRQSCQQIITNADSLSTINSKINGGSQYICIQNGDYTGKGTITITTSGTSSARKVLRYTSDDNNDQDPWDQSGNQARVSRIQLNGASYWIVHRLTVTSSSTAAPLIQTVGSNANNNIIDHVLVDGQGPGGGDGGGVFFGETSTNNNNVLQNSVVRNAGVLPGSDGACVVTGGSPNSWIVNNELYNCTKMVFTWQYTSSPGLVIENNDMYMSPEFYTNCRGSPNASGPCSKGENGISLKAPGTSSNPIRIVHNRLWGIRASDTTVCCAGGGTQGDTIDLFSGDSGAPGPGVDWVLVHNNIVFDGQRGYNGSGFGSADRNDNISVIGNLFWDFRPYVGSWDTGAMNTGRHASSEFHSNTVIAAQGSWLNLYDNSNNDVSCNVAVASSTYAGSAGSGTQVDHNAYYGTSDTGEATKVSNSLKIRADSKFYAVNDIIAISGTCNVATNASCFLYKVTVAGTSAGSAPAYCTTRGCTVRDGEITVEAVRGPYSFKRKLRTVPSGDTVVIPYAAPSGGAREAYQCPAVPGSRIGIGIAAYIQ